MSTPFQPVSSADPSAVDKDWAVIEGSIQVNAPHSVVRNIILDLSRYPDIYPGVEEVESDGRHPSLGSVIRYKYKAGVIRLEMVSTTVELTETRNVSETVQTSKQLTVKRSLRGRNTMSYVPHEGGTLLTIRYEYEQPGSLTGKLMEERVTRKLIERNVQYSVRRVKELAEAAG